MNIFNNVKKTVYNTFAGIGLLLAFFGAAFVVGLILNKEKMEIMGLIKSLSVVFGGSFLYLLCAGKLRKPLYIFVPVTFVGSLLAVTIITSKQYVKGETDPTLFLFIGLVLSFALPLIVYMILERYYSKPRNNRGGD